MRSWDASAESNNYCNNIADSFTRSLFTTHRYYYLAYDPLL
uniref:EF-hand domain-containing protein n=1 Tax=Parascaris univalens TaxID=6257 RepID=A0A915C5H2_PARUN